MKIRNIEEFDNKELINIVLTLHSDHLMFINNWGEFIFGKELNLPNELKNRVFCIWYAGAVDSIIDKEDQVEVLKKECEKRELKNCISLLNEFETLTNAIIEVLKKIEKEDQIILMHHRNTLVHARVYSIHNKNSGFLKYLDSESEKIRKYEGGKDQFWEINRERIIGNLDDYLSPLRELFFERNSSYYGIMSVMTKPDFFKKLTSIAYKDLK